jgi:hypothetical protein
MPTARLQNDLRPKRIGLHECPRILDTSIHVRFGREVNQRIESFFQQSVYQLNVADTPLDKSVSRIALNVGQILEVAGVGQLVEIHDAAIRLCRENVANEVRPDKSGSTGYKDSHC